MTIVHDHTNAVRRVADRNVRAEARGVEEGHTCRWNAPRGLFEVKSDTSGRTYELTVSALRGTTDWLLRVSCSCPAGVKRRQEPGVMVCKHQTRVARRLERMGFARFDGVRWQITRRLADLAGAETEEPRP